MHPLQQTLKDLERAYTNFFAKRADGTPIENRIEDLHSIVEFIDRRHLGPLFRFVDRHTIVDENGRVVSQPSPAGANPGERRPEAMVVRDAATGKNYLKIPLPEKETLRNLVSVFGKIIESAVYP